jgi:hypothetical protein
MLTAELAHNAIVTLVQMYTGVLIDKERALVLANQECERLRAELKKAKDPA